MNKLDPTLAVLVEDAAAARAPRSGGERVHISVKFTGDIRELDALGFDAPSVIRNDARNFTIAAGSIPLSSLDSLARIAHVVSIEGSRPFHPELKDSVPEIRAGSHFPASQFKGRNVVIGVIDTGFDYRHKVFRKENGRTRILALWDQTLKANEDKPRNESPPPGFNFGVEFLPARIDQALAASDDDFNAGLEIVRSQDRLGHGTGVAGIAAGDGSQPGNCEGAFTYVGVAPEAELILVKMVRAPEDATGERDDLAHAFGYIFRHPAAAGRPVVVNFSQGDQLGAHDGTTHLEEVIETLVTEKSGRVVVKSAGNDGNRAIHAEATVPPAPGNVTVDFVVQKEDGTARLLDVWYPAAGRLGVEVLPPGDAVTGNRIVQPDEPRFLLPVPGPRPMRLFITSETNRPENGDNRIRIQLDPDPSVPDPGILSGDWRMRLHNPGAAPVTFHAWIAGANDAPEFTSHRSRDGTLTIPGTSKGVITVAAYVHKGRGRGQVADFSSRGPTRDTRAVQKPDIAAPGRHILSARANKEGSRCSECCLDFYDTEADPNRSPAKATAKRPFFEGAGGTSVAAPHVAGAVALMFEKDPDQTAAQILTAIRASARTGSGIPTPHDNGVGAGFLDVSAALNAIGGGGGGGGAGGGGGPVPFVAPAEGERLPGGPPLAWPGRRVRVADTFATSLPFEALRGRALDTPAGRVYAALVSRYFSEIRGLIRSNRRVGAVWQRIGGPLLVRHLLLGVFEPDRPLPENLAGIPLSSGIRRLFAALRKYGSPELKRDLDRFGPLMLALEGRTLNALLRPGP
jgi:subtilisin family serine protease